MCNTTEWGIMSEHYIQIPMAKQKKNGLYSTVCATPVDYLSMIRTSPSIPTRAEEIRTPVKKTLWHTFCVRPPSVSSPRRTQGW